VVTTHSADSSKVLSLLLHISSHVMRACAVSRNDNAGCAKHNYHEDSIQALAQNRWHSACFLFIPAQHEAHLIKNNYKTAVLSTNIILWQWHLIWKVLLVFLTKVVIEVLHNLICKIMSEILQNLPFGTMKNLEIGAVHEWRHTIVVKHLPLSFCHKMPHCI